MGEIGSVARVTTSPAVDRDGRTATAPVRAQRRVTVQPKLVVGASDDRLEREADTVADRVSAILAGGAPSATTDAVRTAPAGRITRLATIGDAGGAVDSDTETQITRARRTGRPMDAPLRRTMEGAFGADFSAVRMHVGPQSDALNERIQARAFTTGADVFVRRQDYSPGTTSGQTLLAHELAHTIQQGGATASAQRSTATIQRWGFGSSAKAAAEKGAAKGVVAPDADDPVEGHLDNGELVTSAVNSTQVNDIDDYKDELAKASTGDKDADGAGKSGATDEQGQQLGVVGGTADVVGMFIGLAKSVKSFQAAKADGNRANQVGAVLEGAAAVTGGAKGIGSLVKSGSELDGHKDGIGASDAASSALSGIADSFGAVKDTFFAIKKIVDLASSASSMTDEEKFRASMDIIKTSLEAAKGGVSAVKTFLDVCNSGVNVAMVNAVPGLGIAIGCAEIVVRSVDLIQAMIRSSAMKQSKRTAKTKLGGVKGTSMEAKARAMVADPATSADDRAAAEEYLTAKGLQAVNDKRTDRALLKMSVAMAKIAGDAATLGGASAPVGIGLKVSAVVLDLGATAVRKFKQWARDKAAAQEAAGKQGVLSKVFDSSKSSANKLIEYNRILDNVFAMIVKAAPEVLPMTEAQSLQMQKVENYVEAMGFSIRQMEREAAKDADGTKLRAAMISALQRRE